MPPEIFITDWNNEIMGLEMITTYTINLRDLKAMKWYEFWCAEQGMKEIKRFGFRLAFDKERDAERVKDILMEAMKRVKETIRWEERMCERTGYQVMRDTKSSKSIGCAMRAFNRYDRWVKECFDSLCL